MNSQASAQRHRRYFLLNNKAMNSVPQRKRPRSYWNKPTSDLPRASLFEPESYFLLGPVGTLSLLDARGGHVEGDTGPARSAPRQEEGNEIADYLERFLPRRRRRERGSA